MSKFASYCFTILCILGILSILSAQDAKEMELRLLESEPALISDVPGSLPDYYADPAATPVPSPPPPAGDPYEFAQLFLSHAQTAEAQGLIAAAQPEMWWELQPSIIILAERAERERWEPKKLKILIAAVTKLCTDLSSETALSMEAQLDLAQALISASIEWHNRGY